MMKQNLTSLLAGLLFSLGMVHSGMASPQKVQGFLDFFGNWDPSLSLVMLAAVSVNVLAWRLIKNRATPIWGGRFGLPTRRDLDSRLIAGAALFGFGWGLVGYCPGPALATVTSGSTAVLLFVGSMLMGMAVYRAWDEYLVSPPSR